MKELTNQEMLNINGGGPGVDTLVELAERTYEAWEVHHERHEHAVHEHAGSHYHEPSHSNHEEHTLD